MDMIVNIVSRRHVTLSDAYVSIPLISFIASRIAPPRSLESEGQIELAVHECMNLQL